jgi:maleate cis-trans isomerase
MKRLGIIAAPGWLDPTAGEFLARHADQLEVTQTILGPAGFDWSFASIRASEPHLLEAARCLAEAGCECIAQVGPAFAYQAGATGQGARTLEKRLSDAARVPVVLNGCAVLDALDNLGIHRFVAACPYYNPEWKREFRSFMEGAGYQVDGGQSFVDLGLFSSQAEVDARHYDFSDTEVLRALQLNLSLAPGANAVVVSGSGVRTLHWLRRVQAELGAPIISADGALYSAVCRMLDLPPLGV